MTQAYIVDALRTPTGRRKGSLAHVHAIDLGAHVLKALVERNAIPADEYDDVIFGCVDTIGAQAANIARTSGWPPACRCVCLVPRWIASAAHRSRPCTSLRRP